MYENMYRRFSYYLVKFLKMRIWKKISKLKIFFFY